MEPERRPSSGIGDGIAGVLTVVNVVSCGIALWLLSITMSGAGRTGRDELIGVTIVGYPACLCSVLQASASFVLIGMARVSRSFRWAVAVSGLLAVVLQVIQMAVLESELRP